MNTLERFEEMIEGALEGSVATAGRLQPVEIAKKLGRALESGQTIAAGKTLAPNSYTVKISPSDFAVYAPFRQSLERELGDYLRLLAIDRGLSFLSPPHVSITEDAGVRPRRVRVLAAMSDANLGAPGNVTPQFTAPLPVDQVRRRLRQSASLSLADGRSISMDKPVISLGRNLENDVVIEDKRVSRQHAQIRFVHDSFCLYDLASANGTTVNGQPVQQVILRDGDRVALGGFELTFHSAARPGGGRETGRGA